MDEGEDDDVLVDEFSTETDVDEFALAEFFTDMLTDPSSDLYS